MGRRKKTVTPAALIVAEEEKLSLPKKTRRRQIDRRSRLLPLLKLPSPAKDLNGPHIKAHYTSTTTVDENGYHVTSPPKQIAINQDLSDQYDNIRSFPIGETSNNGEFTYSNGPSRQNPKRARDEPLDLGLPTIPCIHCGAFFWQAEALHHAKRRLAPLYSLCCQHGQVDLPLLANTPPLLDKLLDVDGDGLSKHFRNHIRSYNAAFSWTSFGAKLSPYIMNSRGPYSLVLCGENYHYMGSLLPEEGMKPRYAQLYVFDPTTEADDRYSNAYGLKHGLNEDLIRNLQNMLGEENVLAQSFRQVREQLQQRPEEELRLRISGKRVKNNRQYELPSGTELAGLIPGDFEPNNDDRDIIVNHRSKGLTRITSLNPLFDSLHFPLLFPHGNDGYHEHIQYNESKKKPDKQREYVTQREYYAYRLQYRENEGKTLIRSGKALQHFCIDAFTTIEQNRLKYLRYHQKNLRSDIYQGLRDALDRGDHDSKNLGRVINPSSFTGSVRYMKQLYMDATSVCQYYGNPDLFITFTCNAQWPEIINAFKNDVGPNGEDKPAVVARVFKMKLAQLREDLKKTRYLGRSIAGMHTVEFQKRGLPHAHIVIWLAAADKPSTANKVDKIISAEIPDPTVDPVGYESVKKFMLHGPCGLANPSCPCMKEGRCSKFFPKPYNSETTIDSHGYVCYRRRPTNITASKGNAILDNACVVPYNRDLLVKYQAHLNVEVCHKGLLIKYLFKYILKGPDRSTVYPTRVNRNEPNDPEPPIDEIGRYLDCRSISSYEAVWRLLEYKIHERTPSVTRLPIHLPGENTVAWHETQPIDAIISRPNIEKTMLTEWFTLNRLYPSARSYTYSDIPQAFIWDKKTTQWLPRKRGFALGRIYSIPPGSGDVLFLRILLTKLKGCLGFEDMKTIDGKIYDNYQSTCEALGLLCTDDEWNSVMAEISQWAMPSIIRSTFISLLLFCQITSPIEVFERWWPRMADDFKRAIQRASNDPFIEPPPIHLRNQVLQSLQILLANHSTNLSQYGLPEPELPTNHPYQEDLIAQQLQYDQVEELSMYQTFHHALNDCQRMAHDSIIASMSGDGGQFFFLHGHGGTGKTYLYNCIISKVRSEGKIALVVASSGIAATLLPGGVTAHSRFKIPIEVDHTSTCNIKKNTPIARLMQQATLIVWDEAPMVHRLSFEAVDRTLCDILDMPTSGPNYKPFGGKTIILGGDFRQTLPVVPNGGREDNINASLTRSYLWHYCTVLKLHRNMRINDLTINNEPTYDGLCFADWVLSVGDGNLPTVKIPNSLFTDWIKIPQQFLLDSSLEPIAGIVAHVYPSFIQFYQQVQYLRSRAIIAPTNKTVNDINEYVLSMIPRHEEIYLSADSLTTTGSNQEALEVEYPIEFLNNLSFNGTPEHELKFKLYSIVMIMRNLNPTAGLCNGTRMLITHLGKNTIRGLIIGGSYEGTVAVIPRIVFETKDPNWPFTLKRRQYPLRLCYAMTINKSQGQTLDQVGLYLPNPVFSHGQLYVAISRVRSAKGLHVVINNEEDLPKDITRNIVYTDIFEDL